MYPDKKTLKETIAQSLKEAFYDLSGLLDENGEDYNTLLVQLGRFKDLEKDSHLGTVTKEEKRVELAKIRNGLLYLIDNLRPDSFKNGYGVTKIVDVPDYDLEDEFIVSLDELSIEDHEGLVSQDYETLLRLLKRIRLISEDSSTAFEKGTERINRLKKSPKPNQLVAKKIDERVSRDLVIYNVSLKQQLPLLEKQSEISTRNHLKFIQTHFVSSGELPPIWNDIFKYNLSTLRTLTSIEENLYGLDQKFVMLRKEDISSSMKKISKETRAVHSHFIELINQFRRHLTALNDMIVQKS